MKLVEPFRPSGWALDLAASDRLQRRLVFRPADPTAAAAGSAESAGSVQACLVLEGLGTGSWQLTRQATHSTGLQASVQALGLPPADLLALVERVAIDRHFRSDPGVVQARSYRVQAGGTVVLTQGVAQVHGVGPAIKLTLDVTAVRGVAADILLVATREHLALPEDLLAVLGWSWTRLVPGREGWKSKLRLRGSLAARTARAEQALDQAATHLAQTLAEAPGRFHDLHALRRLGVVLRRAIPLLTPLLLVATILLMPRIDTSEGMAMWMVLYHVPTALIVLSFCLQELPTLKPPPWPRRSAAPDWLAQS